MNMNPKKFIVKTYMLIEPDDQEVLTLDEAIKEVAQFKLMQPENVYAIKNINTGDDVYGPD